MQAQYPEIVKQLDIMEHEMKDLNSDNQFILNLFQQVQNQKNTTENIEFRNACASFITRMEKVQQRLKIAQAQVMDLKNEINKSK